MSTPRGNFLFAFPTEPEGLFKSQLWNRGKQFNVETKCVGVLGQKSLFGTPFSVWWAAPESGFVGPLSGPH